MAKININGIELSIDMLDADTVEKYTLLNKRIGQDIKDPKRYEGLSTADGMREQVKLIDAYLDDLFGSGTAKKLFGENTGNLGARLDAFAACATLGNSTEERVSEIIGKYGFNRAQRRAAARAKK